MMMLLKLISILAAHDSPFVCVTRDKAKTLRKGFIVSASTQGNLKQKGKAKHSQKVKEQHKDAFLYQIHCLIFSYTTIPKPKNVLFKRLCGRFLSSSTEISTSPPSRTANILPRLPVNP